MYLYPRGASLGHKELLTPILLRSYSRHPSVHRASFHPRLRPSTSECHISTRHNSKHIAETYRLLLSLCLRRFFSRKTRFYRYPCALKIFLHRYTLRGWKEVRRRTTKNHLGSAFRKTGERRNPGARHAFTAIRYIYWLPDVRHDLYRTPYTHCCWNEFAIWGCTCIYSIDITFFSSRQLARYQTLWINWYRTNN